TSRYAFVEFDSREAAQKSFNKSRTMLFDRPIKVGPANNPIFKKGGLFSAPSAMVGPSNATLGGLSSFSGSLGGNLLNNTTSTPGGVGTSNPAIGTRQSNALGLIGSHAGMGTVGVGLMNPLISPNNLLLAALNYQMTAQPQASTASLPVDNGDKAQIPTKKEEKKSNSSRETSESRSRSRHSKKSDKNSSSRHGRSRHHDKDVDMLLYRSHRSSRRSVDNDNKSKRNQRERDKDRQRERNRDRDRRRSRRESDSDDSEKSRHRHKRKHKKSRRHRRRHETDSDSEGFFFLLFFVFEEEEKIIIKKQIGQTLRHKTYRQTNTFTKFNQKKNE
ncbi:hypothetical protein RFI_22395, partial [Reticulomyxa filosa]